jgi:hypothetical protein
LSGCFFQSCAPYAKASRLLALVARDVPNLVRDALAPTSFVLRLKYVAGVHNQRSSRFQYFAEAAGQHRRCIELSEMTALMTCLEARLVHEIAQQLVERLHADPQHLGELHPLLVGKVGPIQYSRGVGNHVRAAPQVVSSLAPGFRPLELESLELGQSGLQLTHAACGFALLQWAYRAALAQTPSPHKRTSSRCAVCITVGSRST